MKAVCRLLLVFLALAGQGWAHDLGVARVSIEELSPGLYHVEACTAASIELGVPIFPPGFELVGDPTVRARGRSWVFDFTFSRPGESLSSVEVLTLPWPREGAFVRLETAEGQGAGRFFEAQDEGIPVPMGAMLAGSAPLGETLEHYALLGFEHILLGWDHLAFVLCLCLLARGWKLAKLVTAFTIGHSLTLAAAVMGIAKLPIAPVEACIALSIVLVAREALLHGQQTKHGSGLVMVFGLLHGLGFASALSESGIDGAEILPGLIAFNIGVELGQLFFVGLALGAARILIGLLPRMIHSGPALARAVGILAVFWVLDRSIGLVDLPWKDSL